MNLLPTLIHKAHLHPHSTVATYNDPSGLLAAALTPPRPPGHRPRPLRPSPCRLL